MAAKGLDAFVLTHGDAHVSEYLAPCDERIAFISGFNGSNGLCVITKTEALCYTDSRYYLQCEKQMTEGWQMMKMEAGVKQFGDWLKDNLTKGNSVGVDEAQFELNRFNKTRDLLA